MSDGGAGNVPVSYLKWRFEDLLETVEVGLTLSSKSCGGFYVDPASLAPLGACYFDGTFVGVGGGQLGVTRHYMAGVGAVIWGYEEYGWQDFDRRDLTTVQALGVGPIGLLLPPYGGPASALSSRVYVHLGQLGVIANANAMEAVDLAFGFAGIDVGGDDGRVLGLWPGERERRVSPAAQRLHERFVAHMAGERD